MKKTILAVLTVLCFVSCDFLDVPLESTVATSNYYRTTDDFDMCLTGIYNVLLDANGNNRYGSYFSGFMVLGRIGTDELYANYGSNGEPELGQYNYTPANLFISRTWYMMYKGIQRANVVIDRLTPREDLDGLEKDRILGEAHFLRAFFYFHLVRLFGKVPLVTNEVSDPASLDAETRQIKEVYELIVNDLSLAEAMLPVQTTNGRAHRFAAKAMLGKVWLQMAGEPLQDAEAASKAYSKLAEVINEGGYALVDDYFSQFDGKHEYGSEYLWDIEFSNNGTTRYGGQVGTYEGMSTDGDNLYWVQLRSCQEFYETFNEKDLRRDAIARFVLVHNDDGKLVPIYFSSTTPDAVDSYYFAYKFRHGLTADERGAGWANWANPINFPIVRYADVLLMYAEAALRSGKSTTDALEYVNQVRRRGFGKKGSQIFSPDPSIDLRELTYDNLLEERGFELCFEGQRWYDLVRFGKLLENVKKLGKYAYTARGTKQAENIQEKHIFYPIPQDAIDASDGKIQQNDAWR